ncbi:MAG: PQQ-binding-like beta-propeller repeat protein, partial [Planctomycetota bacterium]
MQPVSLARLAAFALLSIALAPGALGQRIRIARAIQLSEPGLHVQGAPIPLAHPDGGMVFVRTRFPVPPNSPGRWRLTRVSEFGEELWTHEPSVGSIETDHFHQLWDVSDDGSVTFMNRTDAGTLVTRLDDAGNVLWSAPLRPLDSRYELQSMGLGEDASGVVYAAYLEVEIAPPVYAPADLVVIGLDPSDGSVLWRTSFDRVRSFQDVDVAVSLGKLGAFVSSQNDVGAYVARVDAAGDVVYRTTVHPLLTPGTATYYPDYIDVRPDGTVLIARDNFDDIASLDPAGNVAWRSDLDLPSSLSTGGGPMPDGDALLHVSCCWLTRVDTDGTQLWTHLREPSNASYRTITTTDEGWIVATLTNHPMDRDGGLELLDGDGVQQQVVQLDFFGGQVTYMSRGRTATDGSIWYGLRVELQGGIQQAYAMQVFVEPPNDEPGCQSTWTNSTGETGLLRAYGSRRASDANATLVASRLPVDQPVLFLGGTGLLWPTPVGGSVGRLCLGGSIARFNDSVQSSGLLGTAALRLDLDAIPLASGLAAVQAGQSWYFQAWHRNRIRRAFVKLEVVTSPILS